MYKLTNWFNSNGPSVAPTKSSPVDAVPSEVEQVLLPQDPQRSLASPGLAVYSSHERERGKENASVASVSSVETKDDVSTGYDCSTSIE